MPFIFLAERSGSDDSCAQVHMKKQILFISSPIRGMGKTCNIGRYDPHGRTWKSRRSAGCAVAQPLRPAAAALRLSRARLADHYGMRENHGPQHKSPTPSKIDLAAVPV